MIIKWKISKHRKDKRHGDINPVKPSKYYKYLANEGAGWSGHEQKRDRTNIKRLQLDDKRD